MRATPCLPQASAFRLTTMASATNACLAGNANLGLRTSAGTGHPYWVFHLWQAMRKRPESMAKEAADDQTDPRLWCRQLFHGPMETGAPAGPDPGTGHRCWLLEGSHQSPLCRRP